MKLFARLSLMGPGLGLIFLAAMPSSASVVGTLYTGGPGTVTVIPTEITFTENDTNNTPSSSTEVGGIDTDISGHASAGGQGSDSTLTAALPSLRPRSSSVCQSHFRINPASASR